MFTATTPKYTFRFKFEASACDVIRVAFWQNEKIVILKKYEDGQADSGMTLNGTDLIVKLTQAETLLFSAGRAGVQLRAYVAGDVKASLKTSVSVERSYDEEIIEV